MTCTCGNAEWVHTIEAKLADIERRVLSDKRLIPEFGPEFWAERRSERKWRHCKYCCRNVPTFILKEGPMGQSKPSQVLRCCWECGAGLDLLEQAA